MVKLPLIVNPLHLILLLLLHLLDLYTCARLECIITVSLLQGKLQSLILELYTISTKRKCIKMAVLSPIGKLAIAANR